MGSFYLNLFKDLNSKYIAFEGTGGLWIQHANLGIGEVDGDGHNSVSTVSLEYDIQAQTEAGHAKTSRKAFREERTSTETVRQAQDRCETSASWWECKIVQPLWGRVGQFFIKRLWPSNSVPWYLPRRNENSCSQIHLPNNGYYGFSHKSPKLETLPCLSTISG